jgi:hypothetical protein
MLVSLVALAGLTAGFALLDVDRANWMATAVSAVASVASIGIAIWTALPVGSGSGDHAAMTGRANAAGRDSKANSGIEGPPDSRGAVAERTGDADATGGGTANTGIRRP